MCIRDRDPVEANIDGINQVMVNNKADLDVYKRQGWSRWSRK